MNFMQYGFSVVTSFVYEMCAFKDVVYFVVSCLGRLLVFK